MNIKQQLLKENETQTMNNAWENWVKELKQLSPFSQSEPTTYQKHLLEKYRKQG